MQNEPLDILVIGCGVSGLTTGLLLQEAGHRVRIWAKTLPPYTTSNAAAAVWHPFKVHPPEKVAPWGAEAFRRFEKLLATPESGVIRSPVLEMRVERGADPAWRGVVGNFRHATAAELLPGRVDGYVFEALVIDTNRYLEYLRGRFLAQGGQIAQRTVERLDGAFVESQVVVNCTGLGARELVGDRDIHPSRGKVVRIRQRDFHQVILDDDDRSSMAYIIPRIDDIVLGGTDEEDVTGEHYRGEEYIESTTLDPEAEAIVQRVARLTPRLAEVTSADVLKVVTGWRPVRSQVRLEGERVTPERILLHNYGHGGAGVTLSWGCAREVVEQLAAMIG
ncbi:MAG TPA: FAD-dependent oxidoreductase [Ktedonobacterales bacterium]|nr:FAD-dependent oxidoreductase [Ktedonobacterales bacterium]